MFQLGRIQNTANIRLILYSARHKYHCQEFNRGI